MKPNEPLHNPTYSHCPQIVIPSNLSFAPQALFFALEGIASHPAPTSALAEPLRKMLTELETHSIYDYFRLRTYIHYHSTIVRKVRAVQKRKGKGLGSHERVSAGMRMLVDGVTFRDLTKAYFEVAEEMEGRMVQNRDGVGVESEEAVEGEEAEGTSLRRKPVGCPIEKGSEDEKCGF